MTKVYLFSDSLRRFAAYVCLGAGVLSVSQMPIATVAQVYAEEPVVEQESAPEETQESVDTPAEETPAEDTVSDDTDNTEETEEVVDTEPVVVSDETPAVIDNATTTDPVSAPADEVAEEIVAPTISDVSGAADVADLASGLPGTIVSIKGSGFTATNTVNFGSMAPITDISSADGTSLSFAVPVEALTDTTYSITVTNAADLTTNRAVDFKVLDAQHQTIRAKVVITDLQNQNGGNVDDVVFLGNNSDSIGNDEWFTVYEDGAYFNDPSTSGYEDVAGLAVRRAGNKISVVLHGSFPTKGWREHVTGYVEFEGATVSCLGQDSANGNPLENGVDKTMSLDPGNDEVWVTDTHTNQSNFWLTVDTGDDGFYTEFDITNSGAQCPGINVIDDPSQSVHLTSLSPATGPIGTVVTAVGTGFTTATPNTVDFGGIVIENITSTNGTTLTFTVPTNAVVGQVAEVSVENANGLSNGQNFTVTDGNTGNGTCSDGIQNGDETGVDTGGRCDDGNGGGGGGGRGGHSGGRRRPRATTTSEVLPNVCAPLLSSYIKYGANNNPDEVVKLQTFLNEHEGEKLAVTGTYDLASFEAVKRFQAKYSSDVLNPWGADIAPTGYVFITTSLKINLLKCLSDEKINLDLRNYYPNPGAPGQEIGAVTPGGNDDRFTQATTSTSTGIATASTSDEVSTSTSYFQLAAAGILDFLSIYPWWWWLLVIVLVVVISWLLKKSDDDDDQDDEQVTPQTGYLPLS